MIVVSKKTANFAYAVGRNGSAKVTAVNLREEKWFDVPCVDIQFVTSKGEVLHGGATIDRDAMDALCLKWILARNHAHASSSSLLLIPDEHWQLMQRTLEMDSESSVFERELRDDIVEALGHVVSLEGEARTE